MALNIPNIAPQPIGGYTNASMNAVSQAALENRKRELENQYYGPNIESEMGYRNALAQGQNIENQYMPEKLKLANAYQNLINSFYPEKTRAEIGLNTATADEKRALIPYIPTKYANETRNSLTSLGKLNATTSNIFRLWSQTPEGQQIIKNRPDIANAVLQNIEQQASLSTGNPINNPPEQSLMNPVKQSVSPSEGIVPAVKNDARDQLIKNIQQGASDSYERTNLPADTKKRLYAGGRYKTTVPSVLENFDKAKVYFSPKGQVRLKADEIRAASDKRVPESLQAYRQFKQGLDQLKVQGAFLEGVPADQISRAAYAGIYDISKFFNNPTDAMESLKYAINLALMADKSNQSSLSDIKGENPNDQTISDLMSGNNITPPEKTASSGATSDNKVIKVVFAKDGKTLVRSDS